ncbi:MAG: hypothetical protein U1F87_16950 [Kiritimatiellia bacterium]
MATLNPAEDIFLDDPENALLLSRPSTGPELDRETGGDRSRPSAPSRS